MLLLSRIVSYFVDLRSGKVALWCYLIWYANTVAHHFDSTPRIWLNSLGISAVVGVALVLSVGSFSAALKERWQLFRLFAMPFGVSSFSSLIKGQGFFIVVPPDVLELASSLGLCALFVLFIYGLRRVHRVASI
jgi:hypothetical protein